MAENEIRPSRYVSPQRDYQPRQAYRRPGSDLSRVPSKMETAMSERPQRWQDLEAEARRERVVALLDEHGPMVKGKLCTLLRVSSGTAGGKKLDNALQILRRDGRVSREGDYWLLPHQGAPCCAACGELVNLCRCPPKGQEQPKPEASIPASTVDDPARTVEVSESDHAQAITPDKLAITSEGTVMLWIDGAITELSATAADRIHRMVMSNLRLVDGGIQREKEAKA